MRIEHAWWLRGTLTDFAGWLGVNSSVPQAALTPAAIAKVTP